jgi:hypothetical protein
MPQGSRSGDLALELVKKHFLAWVIDCAWVDDRHIAVLVFREQATEFQRLDFGVLDLVDYSWQILQPPYRDRNPLAVDYRHLDTSPGAPGELLAMVASGRWFPGGIYRIRLLDWTEADPDGEKLIYPETDVGYRTETFRWSPDGKAVMLWDNQSISLLHADGNFAKVPQSECLKYSAWNWCEDRSYQLEDPAAKEVVRVTGDEEIGGAVWTHEGQIAYGAWRSGYGDKIRIVTSEGQHIRDISLHDSGQVRDWGRTGRWLTTQTSFISLRDGDVYRIRDVLDQRRDGQQVYDAADVDRWLLSPDETQVMLRLCRHSSDRHTIAVARLVEPGQ